MSETNIIKPLYHNDYADLNLLQLRSSFIEIKFLKMLLNGTTALLFHSFSRNHLLLFSHSIITKTTKVSVNYDI